jgi:hexosaminidase
MKKIFLLFSILFISVITFCQDSKKEIAIIPEPVTTVRNTGEFVLPQEVTINAASESGLQRVIAFLTEKLSVATGYKTSVSNNASQGAIRLTLNASPDDALGNEGYHLSVTTTGVEIKANKPAGLFYGAQTLVQLFPAEIESNTQAKNVEWKAPCVEITDYPRFKWRGLMLDVSRHFFDKKDVENYIDEMARYKFNVFHWHLTDDQGWRIEIKSLPNLTKKGAWNVKKTGYFGSFSAPAANEPRNFGGFYTQDDVKEIIQYAKERFVDILPEIDMPGHSLAAVASYPELSCTPGADKYQVNSGESFMDWSHGAPPIALVDNTLCPANEKVYDFVDKVVGELAQLFPFAYIHLGGDECPKNFWEKSSAVKALMQKENLKTMQEVQSYFEKRVEKIVESKGKKLIGWDEILEGGLAPGAAVMSWRGIEGGIEAAKMKHEVVMSPTTFAYIDYMQGDPILEPRIYASLRLNKAYQFEPVPPGVDAKYILGGQANLWTEQVYNLRHAEYMTWPRAFAIAESVWSPKEKKNWNDFIERVEQHFKRFDEGEIKYAPSVYDPIFKISKTSKGEYKVELSTEIKDLDIYYTFDNSFPDRFYPKYKEPLIVPKDAANLRVITYEGKKEKGRLITMPVEVIKRRADAKRGDDE